MSFGRRLLGLLCVVALIGLPAVALQVFCLGKTCSTTAGSGQSSVPFCPLPAATRAGIVNGYRQGRSPDVMGVTKITDLAGITGRGHVDVAAPWPSIAPTPDTQVPIAFFGQGVHQGTRIPDGTGLDNIAGTLATIIHFTRPFPHVRAGTLIPAVVKGGPAPRLVLEVAWKGVGSADLRAHPTAWPYLRSLMKSGASGLGAVTGSLPLDPAATLTTIGTGGLPSQHGITGTLVLNDQAQLTQAWGKAAPISIIATLGDDYLHQLDLGGQSPMMGMIGTNVSDRGLVGGTWYVPHPKVPVVLARGEKQMPAFQKLLATGFGSDQTPDILGVVMRDSLAKMDTELKHLVSSAEKASRGSLTVAVAGTGSAAVAGTPSPASLIAEAESAVKGPDPVIEAATPGGFFLNQTTLGKENLTQTNVVDALDKARAPGGGPLWANVFPSFAVSFAKYC